MFTLHCNLINTCSLPHSVALKPLWQTNPTCVSCFGVPSSRLWCFRRSEFTFDSVMFACSAQRYNFCLLHHRIKYMITVPDDAASSLTLFMICSGQYIFTPLVRKNDITPFVSASVQGETVIWSFLHAESIGRSPNSALKKDGKVVNQTGFQSEIGVRQMSYTPARTSKGI